MKEYNVYFQIADEMHCETYRNMNNAIAAYNEKIGHCEKVELCEYLPDGETDWSGEENVIDVWEA